MSPDEMQFYINLFTLMLGGASIPTLVFKWINDKASKKEAEKKRKDDAIRDQQVVEGKASLAKLENKLVLIKANADDKKQDNENLKSVIEIIKIDSQTTAKLATELANLRGDLNTSNSTIETSISKNGKAIKESSDRTVSTIGILSDNMIEELVAVKLVLNQMSSSLENNGIQSAKFEGLITELEDLVSKLNVITEAKDKTNPIPSLEEILGKPSVIETNVQTEPVLQGLDNQSIEIKDKE